MKYGKIFAFLGMAILGASVFGVLSFWGTSLAQTSIKPLKLASITSVSSSNPAGNYYWSAAHELWNDNNGISVWTGNFPTPYTECGHLGMAASLQKTTDPQQANVWENRNTCNGNIAVGVADKVEEQVLTINGVTQDGKNTTITVNVPAMPTNNPGNWRLYVDDTGATYHCRADHNYATLRYPNDCDLTIEQALTSAHLARSGNSPVCGNNLCQNGETYASCPADCPLPPTTCTLTTTKTSYTKPEFVNYTYTCSAPASVAVQVVKPDGTATTYNTSTNITTSTMGFDTSNLSAGAHLLRICVNDTTCSSNSRVEAQFYVAEPTVSVGSACSPTGSYGCAADNNTQYYCSPSTSKWEFSQYCSTSILQGRTCNAVTGMCKATCGDGICGTYETAADCPGYNDCPATTSGAANGLVGHWKFDGNGNNEIASGPSASTFGGASFKTSGGKLNGYAYIQSSGDYVKIPYNSAFDLPNDFTVEFWFRQRADRSFLQDLVYKGSAPNNYNFRIFRQLWNEYNFGPIIAGHTVSGNGYWTQASNPNQLEHNVWHHVAYTKNATAQTYYLDGVLTHSKDFTQYTEYSGSAKTPVTDIYVGNSAVDTDIDDLKIYNRALSQSEITQIGGFPTTSTTTQTTTQTTVTPGASAPEPSNNEAGVWAQVDIATGQILTAAICTRSVCGINGEYHGYVPPSSWATGSTWWPTPTRYIWQVPGQAGHTSGTFNFSTYVFTVAGGTIYNGVFTPTATPTTTTTGTTTGTTTTITTPTTAPTTTPTTTAGACNNGQTCASGSWCQNGSMCYYSDSRITCVAWPATTTAVMSPGMMGTPSCPADTTACNPTEVNCVNPGQTVPYSSSSSKWCMGAQSYYSNDGRNMMCVKNGDTAPAGYSNCRPDDTNCIATGAYGSSSGYCGQGMKCYQKAIDSNSRNDTYCAPMPYGTGVAQTEVTCPIGYSVCPSGDEFCKAKGDKWTSTSNSYYCMMSQKCNISSGGGVCVGWSESCPAGTRYCSAGDNNCIEPGEYKTTDGSAMSYWCGGSGGMTFHSRTKVYCAAGKTGSPMWTAADVKAVLGKLGAGWGLCRPNETNCIEPGQTGSSAGWCAWMLPGSYSSNGIQGSTRTCPSLDGDDTANTGSISPVITTPVTPATPPPFNEMRECAPGEMPNANNYCRMPMYHWNILAKMFEKCSQADMTAYTSTGTADSAKQKYTSCESMNFEIEKEWRTDRYMVHPPEIEGPWYMPPWDAASPMLQYNPTADKLEDCKNAAPTATAFSAGEIPPYISTCMPVPDKDKSWMLKKFRAEYKLYLMNKNQIARYPAPIVVGSTTVQMPVPTTPLPQEMLPQIPAAQCKSYLLGIKQGLNADKKFWKDTKSQFTTVPKSYPDYESVAAMLNDSKAIILDLDKLLGGAAKCDQDRIGAIKAKLDNLHTAIFSQLSAYMPDIQNFVDYQRCRDDLVSKEDQLAKLLANGLDDETKQEVKNLIATIDTQLKELQGRVSEFDYDAGFECRQVAGQLDSEMAPLTRANDQEINRIIEDVVNQKMQPVLADLSAQLEERGKKIDELLVRVALLHKAVEQISKTATQISEQVAVSYTALSYIDEKYSAIKQEMEDVKEKMLPNIETATTAIKENNCIRGADMEKLVNKFGVAASVNWFGARADEMSKRINLFVTACKNNAVTQDDVNSFVRGIDEASVQNLKESYNQGLTPFPDVPTHEWYFGGMLTCSRTGAMTQGRPAENVLRQDALLMVLRATGSTDADLIGNCDVERMGVGVVSPYAACAVKRAMEKGIALSGSMQVPVDRAEIAQWLKKLANLPDASQSILHPTYKDLSGLSSSELDSIASVVASQVMVGNVSGTTGYFTPRAPLTRAALAVILDKLLSLKQPQ